MTTTQDVALRLITLCRRCEFVAAQRELYSADAVSIEPVGYPGPRESHGAPALAEKMNQFHSHFEAHACEMSEPLVAGDFFACSMVVDVTDRASGARFPLVELCVFTVSGGKITREEFFYTPKS